MSRRLQLVTLLLALAGCSEPLQKGKAAERDLNHFTGYVMPVLLRDCGFQACHGSQERFFRVFGPGRTRYIPPDPTIPPRGPLEPLSGYERDYTMQLALSMIDEEDPARSMLLRKPLAVEAGGASHEGIDKYGRNVYRTPDDEGYLEIARWVFAEPAPMAGAGATTPPVAGASGTLP